mmetsp:Transcript_7655/g.6782  ORF Transcript_7655/g.6782 Transcript_7655/m.6782 type:complete len:149 (-) Transcript_7655:24-470(-)
MFVERGNIYQAYELLSKLKIIIDDKLSDYITSEMEEFFNTKIRTLEISIKSCLEFQLNEWVENLQNEQERIGIQIKGFSETKLSQNPSSKPKPNMAKGGFRDTYKSSFRPILTQNFNDDDSETSSQNIADKTLRDLRGDSRGSIYFTG